MTDEYEDEPTQEDKDLMLHIAKMFEHMEWENTLPEQEKSRRRLGKLIAETPTVAVLAAQHNMPWMLLGHFERIDYHLGFLFGDDWRQQAREEREAWTRDTFGDLWGDDDEPDEDDSDG